MARTLKTIGLSEYKKLVLEAPGYLGYNGSNGQKCGCAGWKLNCALYGVEKAAKDESDSIDRPDQTLRGLWDKLPDALQSLGVDHDDALSFAWEGPEPTDYNERDRLLQDVANPIMRHAILQGFLDTRLVTPENQPKAWKAHLRYVARMFLAAATGKSADWNPDFSPLIRLSAPLKAYLEKATK